MLLLLWLIGTARESILLRRFGKDAGMAFLKLDLECAYRAKDREYAKRVYRWLLNVVPAEGRGEAMKIVHEHRALISVRQAAIQSIAKKYRLGLLDEMEAEKRQWIEVEEAARAEWMRLMEKYGLP